MLFNCTSALLGIWPINLEDQKQLLYNPTSWPINIPLISIFLGQDRRHFPPSLILMYWHALFKICKTQQNCQGLYVVFSSRNLCMLSGQTQTPCLPTPLRRKQQGSGQRCMMGKRSLGSPKTFQLCVCAVFDVQRSKQRRRTLLILVSPQRNAST